MRLLFIEACSNVSQVYDQLDRTARNNHNKVIFLITVVVLEHVESITTLWETDVGAHLMAFFTTLLQVE